MRVQYEARFWNSVSPNNGLKSWTSPSLAGQRGDKNRRGQRRGGKGGEEETLSSFKAWGPHSHFREQVPTNVSSFTVLEWPGSFPSSPGLNNNTLFSLVIWLLVFDPQHLGQELGALGSPLTLLTDHSLHHWIWFSSLEGVALGE